MADQGTPNSGKAAQTSYELVERRLSFTQGTDQAVQRWCRKNGKASLREAYRSLVAQALLAAGESVTKVE